MENYHVPELCEPCKGGAANRRDHYALGQLRQKIGVELGITPDAATAAVLGELLHRWRDHRRSL